MEKIVKKHLLKSRHQKSLLKNLLQKNPHQKNVLMQAHLLM
jgi:hypothetical protein